MEEAAMAATKEHTNAVDEAGEMADDAAGTVGAAMDRVPEMIENVRSSAGRAAASLPDAADRARTGVEETTARLQTMPDDTLRILAAGSIGLAAGFLLAGAPRLVTVVAIAPAFFVAGAIATRSR
jgi:ABC-type transporter Mla subunit MlaD